MLTTTNTSIPLVEGGVYYMGPSNSPSRIRIYRIDKPVIERKASVQYVRYERLPIRRPEPDTTTSGQMAREDARFLEGAIRRGTKTKLDQLTLFLKTERAAIAAGSDAFNFHQQQVEHLRSVLNGFPVTPTDRIDCTSLDGFVTVNRYDGDGWSLIDSLTGGCCNASCTEEGKTVYQCTVFGTKGFKELYNDPHITFLRVIWDSVDVLPDLRERIGLPMGTSPSAATPAHSSTPSP